MPRPNPVALPPYFSEHLFDVHLDVADGMLVAKAKDYTTAMAFVKAHQTHAGADYVVTQQIQQKPNCVTRHLCCKRGGKPCWEVSSYVVPVALLQAW